MSAVENNIAVFRQRTARSRRAKFVVVFTWMSIMVNNDNFLPIASAWYIAPPRVRKEWEQLAGLLVDSFETPDPQQASMVEQWTWNLYQRRQSVRQTYRQYAQTARKMQRMKHAILLAKEPGRGVIGVVEMGIDRVHCPSTEIAATEEERNPDDNENTSKRVLIGVLCVDAEYRHQGVATSLVQRCVSIASDPDTWGGDYESIYTEVEPGNENAMSFFESMGFVQQDDCGGSLREVTVRRRNRLERKPHLLLARPLNATVILTR